MLMDVNLTHRLRWECLNCGACGTASLLRTGILSVLRDIMADHDQVTPAPINTCGVSHLKIGIGNGS